MTRALNDIERGLADYAQERDEWDDTKWTRLEESLISFLLGHDDQCPVCGAFTCVECFACAEQHGNSSACSCHVPWPGEPGYVEVTP